MAPQGFMGLGYIVVSSEYEGWDMKTLGVPSGSWKWISQGDQMEDDLEARYHPDLSIPASPMAAYRIGRTSEQNPKVCLELEIMNEFYKITILGCGREISCNAILGKRWI